MEKITSYEGGISAGEFLKQFDIDSVFNNNVNQTKFDDERAQAQMFNALHDNKTVMLETFENHTQPEDGHQVKQDVFAHYVLNPKTRTVDLVVEDTRDAIAADTKYHHESFDFEEIAGDQNGEYSINRGFPAILIELCKGLSKNPTLEEN